MKNRSFLFAVCFALPAFAHGAPLSRATITEVVKDVSVVSVATKAQQPARTQQLFHSPDVLRTGAESRAEMVAEDRTITRVGANTLFSFEPGKREIHLQRGSVLFQSPAGKGGGTIRTAAATASVLGTTLIVVTTKDGGFKILLLEGTGKVVSAGGAVRVLHAGEMTFLLPGGKIGPVRVFQLQQQVSASRLVSGFRKPLPSLEKIGAAIRRQEARIGKRELAETGLLLGDSPDAAYAVISREVLLNKERGASRRAALAGNSGPSRFQNAVASDATITGGKLDPARVFLFGTDDGPELATPPKLGALSQNGGALAGDAALFIARNTTLAASTINLSPFAGRSLFQFLSLEDLTIAGSVNFSPLPGTQLSLVAGGTIRNTPGAVLRAHTPLLEVLALGSGFPLGGNAGALTFSDAQPLMLDGLGLENTGGDLGLLGPTTTLRNTSLAALGNVIVRAAGDLTVIDSRTGNPKFLVPPDGVGGSFASTTPNKRGLEAGDVLDVRAQRDIFVQRVDLSAEHIFLAAGGALRMKAVRASNKDFSQARGTVDLRAGTLLDIAGARFQVRDVSLAARTINLRDVSFAGGSRVVLDSQNGQLASQPNTNRPSQPGFVNFIDQVTYGGQPAEFFLSGGDITIK